MDHLYLLSELEVFAYVLTASFKKTIKDSPLTQYQ